MTKPIVFEDFQPGARMGETSLVYTDELAAQWQRIFGASQNEADGAAKGASIATVMMMRAYMSVVAPRPPGNVHARQRITLDNVPEPNETVRTEIHCSSKEMRRERRYVELQVAGTGHDGRPLYRGTMTLIWAQ